MCICMVFIKHNTHINTHNNNTSTYQTTTHIHSQESFFFLGFLRARICRRFSRACGRYIYTLLYILNILVYMALYVEYIDRRDTKSHAIVSMYARESRAFIAYTLYMKIPHIFGVDWDALHSRQSDPFWFYSHSVRTNNNIQIHAPVMHSRVLSSLKYKYIL